MYLLYSVFKVQIRPNFLSVIKIEKIEVSSILITGKTGIYVIRNAWTHKPSAYFVTCFALSNLFPFQPFSSKLEMSVSLTNLALLIAIVRIRQPPALPYRLQHSTIGRLSLNHRVRDENGCVP